MANSQNLNFVYYYMFRHLLMMVFMIEIQKSNFATIHMISKSSDQEFRFLSEDSPSESVVIFVQTLRILTFRPAKARPFLK